MIKFWKCAIFAALAALSAGAAADPVLDRAVQHDVIAWHLAQGETSDQACAVVEQYFAVRCVVAGSDFVLTRGTGTEITYLVTIREPPKESP